jgi:hypothetical protein
VKSYLITAAIAIAVVALVFRIPQVRKAVAGM